MKKHWIYKIENKINLNFYVGRTAREKRIKEHISNLKKNKHHCLYLQRAWNKYGEDNFQYTIIEKNLTEEEAIERENYYLSNFQDVLYNIGTASMGGDNFSNNPNKEKIREAISKKK